LTLGVVEFLRPAIELLKHRRCPTPPPCHTHRFTWTLDLTRPQTFHTQAGN